MNDDFTVGVAALALVAYLLPTVLAILRGHLSWPAIFALNLFLGWTLVVWIVALVWSLTGNTRRNARAARSGPPIAVSAVRGVNKWAADYARRRPN